MVATGRGGAAADPGAGAALQQLAHETSPPEEGSLPAVDAGQLTVAQQARAKELLAALKHSPDLLATLDQSSGGITLTSSLGATPASPLTKTTSGTDEGGVAPPSALQR
jgi:hypothetical protein